MTKAIFLTKQQQTDLLSFAQELVRIQSYSGEEEEVAKFIAAKMESLGFDEVLIDGMGNVFGRIGTGPVSILFESHTDTVRVHDTDEWEVPPFSGEIRNGFLWGRGSVDMKSGLAASVYAAALARDADFLDGKTVYVSCTVFEEDCDGEGIKYSMKAQKFTPDYAVICEPSGNKIALGHKGKAQMIVKTHGVSAHGSAPEKGINAIYEMAEIIQRVEATNNKLAEKDGHRGTLVLSRISSTGVSLNAVPSECEIYLDRRTVPGETEETVRVEMEKIIAGKNASWAFDTVRRTAWTGATIVYEPLHNAWKLSLDDPLAHAAIEAFSKVFGETPADYEFWDFSTNAVALINRGISCVGFGPGEHKLAHMRDERCSTQQIIDACRFYTQLIEEIA